MRTRRLSLCFVLIGTAALEPSCAQGLDDSATEISETTASEDGGAPACVGCPKGYLCSSGQCVSATGDADGDGFAAKDDCDDTAAKIHPGAEEICNGRDDNCDGRIDEGFDADGDGWVSCAIGSKPADCNDDDPLINPGAPEVCNGKDDNCDGKIDEIFDKDNDGFYACPRDGLPFDCDDDDPAIKPGASEQCNGKDDDCDGKIDELPAMLAGSLTAPIDPHWALAGSALFQNGWVQLTPEQTYKAGALWWNASYVFDSFEVTGTFWMPNRTDCADGIAFAFVPGTNVAATGEAGYGYGVQGLGGYAVAIDTFTNPGQPPAPFLVVLDAQTGTHLIRQAVPEVRNAQEHQLRVRLDAGKISVWLDSVGYVFDFPIPSYAPFAGHWGFTAGTGGLTCAHWVRGVTMSFPNGQGCVP